MPCGGASVTPLPAVLLCWELVLGAGSPQALLALLPSHLRQLLQTECIV